jgi:type IV pilus assembly protein PilQ
MKGKVMKNNIFNSTLAKGLVLTACIAMTFSTAFAQGVGEEDGSNEVLSKLEQQMQKTITVDFRDTLIDDVLRIMAEQADVDIIKSPSVIGNVTASLTDVPLQEALTNILASHNYGYVLSKNMIRVASISEIANENTERLASKIYRITYADIKSVEDALKKFISKRGYISSSLGTSNIIVTDIESKIKAIDKFIVEIDRMTPQILVEARIYDITASDNIDLGVQWTAGRRTTYPGGLTGVGTNPDVTTITDPFMTGAVAGATSTTADATLGVLRFGWLNDSIDIDALLTAEQEDIQAKLLANPRILVLDNEMAQFKIVSELPYQEISESTFGGALGQTKFREVGVDLIVTPHVTRDGMVKLQLAPKFSIRGDDEPVGTATTGVYPVPVVNKREANTILLVKSGNTVVLGGMKKKDVLDRVNKVPILGDIPLLGELFKFNGEQTVNSEIVVFVTPNIIDMPTMTEEEKKAYKETIFNGPEIKYTGAEKVSMVE